MTKPDGSRPDVSPEMVEIIYLFFYREQNGIDMPPLPSLSEGKADSQSVHPSNTPRTVSASLAIPASDRSSAFTVWRLSQWLKLRPSERLYCGS